MTTPTRDKRCEGGGGRSITLVFCRPRPDQWIMRLLAWLVGNPLHVDVVAGNTAYAVSPSQCIQWPAAEWIEGRIRAGVLYDTVTIPVIGDHDHVIAAAEIYCVGPMTHWGIVRRMLGLASIMDVDCVAGAMIVCGQAGHKPPRKFRTAKGLYLWSRTLV